MLFLRLAALGQGIVYLLTGIWPLVSRSSFERVTGPKREWWLVEAVGVLLGVVGAVLLWSGLRRAPISPEMPALGIGTAASLAGVDIFYTARGRIPPVYLLDAAGELVLVALWSLGLASRDQE